MWVKFSPGEYILRTPSWKIFQDDDWARGHINAMFAPRCDFHTYETISPKVGATATLIRQSSSLFWWLGGDLDNQDHGTEYDLLGEDFVRGENAIVCLFPRAMSGKEVRDIVRQGP